MALSRQAPYILSFSLFMILAGLTLPRSSDYSLIYYFALWFTLFILSAILMFIHGLAWPRLLPLTETIHYNDPGFRSGYYGTGFGVDFSKLKSSANAQWVTKGIRRCLKLRLATWNIFIILDSHSRPSYPNGAGMIVSPQLSMQAEIAELRSQNEFLKSEQQRLESEIEEAEARSREQYQADPAAAAAPPPPPPTTTTTTTTTIQIVFQKYSDHFFAPPRQLSSLTRQSSTPSFSKASTSTLNPFASIFNPFTSSLNPFGPDPRSAGSSSSRALGSLGRPPIPPSDRDDSILEAMRRLQNEFDKEDRTPSAQRAELAKSTQRLFECGICMEEMPDDSIARPDPCRHTFCRECLRGHVTTRLDEHRFPILCPTCTAGKGKGKEAVGEVSQSLALDLGLTDEQYGIWTEMELVSFSVLLYCRKCQRTMFVARDDHDEAKIIFCPLPDCKHAWCKQCQQSINFNGPKHSCDGSSELDHLMKGQGWKYCPTCKTPIQKISGCNHMSCVTPACNTHFCYICGGLIVKSALGQEINEAISAHYRKNCALFEVPE